MLNLDFKARTAPVKIRKIILPVRIGGVVYVFDKPAIKYAMRFIDQFCNFP